MTLVLTIKKFPIVISPGVFLLETTILLLLGCATNGVYQKSSAGVNYPGSSYVEGVPFFPQEEFQCGPAVLASVLNFWGYKVDPEEISKAIYLRHLEGTLKMDMAGFAEGFEKKGGALVLEVQGDLELIKKDILSGYPLIVFVDLGFWDFKKGHYMLIVGYDDRRAGVIAYSGREKDKFIPYGRFMRTWERGGHWALRIIPE